MAISWLKVEVATPDKPEVMEMSAELGLDPDAVFGKLFRVWSWFDSHSEDGNAPSVTEVLLDRQVGVTGFVTAMVNVGWMIKKDSLLIVPNFDNHNGSSSKNRANTARRVAKSRICNGKGNGICNDDVTPKPLHKALAREDKIRLELIHMREKVSDHWNQVLTPLGKPKFVKWSDSRIKHFKARCEEDSSRDLDWWLALVDTVPSQHGAMNGAWFDLEWLIKSENNLVKFCEGKYKTSFEKPEQKIEFKTMSDSQLQSEFDSRGWNSIGMNRYKMADRLEAGQ